MPKQVTSTEQYWLMHNRGLDACLTCAAAVCIYDLPENERYTVHCAAGFNEARRRGRGSSHNSEHLKARTVKKMRSLAHFLPCGVTELAQHAGCSRTNIYYWLDNGYLVCTRQKADGVLTVTGLGEACHADNAL